MSKLSDKISFGQRPTANGQRPTANGQRPTANGQRPTANGQRHGAALFLRVRARARTYLIGLIFCCPIAAQRKMTKMIVGARKAPNGQRPMGRNTKNLSYRTGMSGSYQR